MRRRDVIIHLGGAAAAWSLAARAQQLSKPRRIGLLTSSSRPVSIESSYHAGILLGMRELGYVEGKDFIIEWRFAEGKLERFADFAAELVQLNVDVLVPATPTAIPAVRQATRTIPIVMGFSTDPVGNGFIASLAHPGGNITGLASSQDDAAPKQLEFLGMAVPYRASGFSWIGAAQILRQSSRIFRMRPELRVSHPSRWRSITFTK
jgi:putative ABC transport system substrate-binding protein